MSRYDKIVTKKLDPNHPTFQCHCVL